MCLFKFYGLVEIILCFCVYFCWTSQYKNDRSTLFFPQGSPARGNREKLGQFCALLYPASSSGYHKLCLATTLAALNSTVVYSWTITIEQPDRLVVQVFVKKSRFVSEDNGSLQSAASSSGNDDTSLSLVPTNRYKVE